MTFDPEKTKERRYRVADAQAEAIGKLLHEARQTDDPITLLDIKAKIESYDEFASLDSLLVVTDFLLGTKPGELKAATEKRDKAQKAVADKRDQIAQTVAKLNAELDAAVEAYQDANQEHAIAAVAHNRWKAVTTGESEPGYHDYASPVIRAWAKHAKII